MTSPTTQLSGRPLTVVDGRLRYLDEQHLPEHLQSVVTIADAMSADRLPVPYPSKAVAAPDRFTGWRDSTSCDRGVLVQFRYWFVAARGHILRRGTVYAEGFADAMYVHGPVSHRTKRRVRL